MTDAAIRLAKADDLPAINDIYNHNVLHSTCTYQETPEPIEERRQWFSKHGPVHPVTVAEMNGRVVGWGCCRRITPGRLTAIRLKIPCMSGASFIGKELGRRFCGT